ncbi:AAA family ATPase [Neobacillus sp. NPDC093127]|uniref:SF1B family DNA helicase RecD2 n=1 Tax=Neobacillus sp. NPDC093127 TaxID=3364296 RepID=UPI0037F49F95
MREEIRGVVEEIIYQNSLGWGVLKIRIQNDLIKAVGLSGKVHIGETWLFKGYWEEDFEYGFQFKIEAGFPTIPEKGEEIIALLSGSQFPGIGTATASNLVKAYGEKLWWILENDPNKIAQDRIITPRKTQVLLNAFKGLKSRWELMKFLVKNGLPLRLLEPLSTLYSDKGLERIIENPYRLLPFLSWKKVDSLRKICSIHHEDIRRREAGIIHVMQKNLGIGNTAINKLQLIEETSRLLSIAEELVTEVLHEPLVYVTNDNRIQLTGIASQERTISKVFADLSIDVAPLASEDWVKKWINDFEEQQNITLESDQKLAVFKAVTHRIFVLTGGPGTGKTLVINAIRSILEDLGQKVILAAPTGRAAKRIQEVTNEETKTLHRTFGYSQKNFDFNNNEKLPTLIIDESSMVDVRMWSKISTCVDNETRIIIVGDPGQLPSIGPGQVLNDILQSNIASVSLTKIHRQTSDNPIPYAAFSIRNGEVPVIQPWKRELKGLYLIKQENEEIGLDWTVRLAVEALCQEGFLLDDIQILSPRKNGSCGTKNINCLIRKKLKMKNINNFIPFSINDRVIQTVNNYDLGSDGIMNGSTGKVQGGLGDDGIIVNFDGEIVELNGNNIDDIDLAYAISVHKSQGSQYRVVILPLFPSAGSLITRQLIYTAITRATDLVIIIGTEELLRQAVKFNATDFRNTGFSYHLNEALIHAAKKPKKTVSLQLELFDFIKTENT